MKLCRYKYNDREFLGVLEVDKVYPIEESTLFDSITQKKDGIDVNKISFLCPTQPRTIFAIGLNYRQHAKEMGMKPPKEPLIFIKAVSSLTTHNNSIIQPKQTKELSCEAELAIVVKKKCKDVSLNDAKDYILGYSLINDVTARDIQRRESQWTRAKSFDTFCPYGPVIETDIEKAGSGIRLYVDDKLIQNGALNDMVFSPQEIIAYVSSQCTLNAGDVIATGTPSGVTTVFPGQRVVVEIDNIGRLENKVIYRGE